MVLATRQVLDTREMHSERDIDGILSSQGNRPPEFTDTEKTPQRNRPR